MLFGSYAREFSPPGSDLDLAVHTLRPPSTFHQFRSYACRRFYDDAKFRRWGWEYLRRA